MTLLAIVALAAVAVVGGAAAVAVVVSQSRGARKRNRVVPGVATNAPVEWAGAHTPEARLHRRLIAAVASAATSAPDGAHELLAARTALETEAIAVDERLIAVAATPGPERAELMERIAAQVSGVEKAAAALVEARLHGDPVSEVEAELARVRLLAQARAEVEQLDREVTDPTLGTQTSPPPAPKTDPPIS